MTSRAERLCHDSRRPKSGLRTRDTCIPYVGDDVTLPARPPSRNRIRATRRSSTRRPGAQRDRTRTRAALQRVFHRYFALQQASAALHRGHAEWPQGLHPPRRAPGAVRAQVRVRVSPVELLRTRYRTPERES